MNAAPAAPTATADGFTAIEGTNAYKFAKKTA